MFQNHIDQDSDSYGLIVESRGFMSVLVCPPDIRRWFETDPDRLENQLFDLLHNPTSDAPQNVSLWITRFAHTHLSPDTILARESALIQQRIWISFALRYLHPVRSGLAQFFGVIVTQAALVAGQA